MAVVASEGELPGKLAPRNFREAELLFSWYTVKLGTVAVKTAAALALVLSSLIAATAVQAQERQVTVYSGTIAVELPTSILRGTTSGALEASQGSSAGRKVRVVLQSPYGN